MHLSIVVVLHVRFSLYNPSLCYSFVVIAEEKMSNRAAIKVNIKSLAIPSPSKHAPSSGPIRKKEQTEQDMLFKKEWTRTWVVNQWCFPFPLVGIFNFLLRVESVFRKL